MTYSLRRDRDGAGDSGPMSLVAWQLEDGTIKYEHDARPTCRCNCSCRNTW
jgi:hypothetical protein